MGHCVFTKRILKKLQTRIIYGFTSDKTYTYKKSLPTLAVYEDLNLRRLSFFKGNT